MLNDPHADFKFVEKRENELENHFDKKIQTNKERESDHVTNKSKANETNQKNAAPEEKKKANQFDEVAILQWWLDIYGGKTIFVLVLCEYNGI